MLTELFDGLTRLENEAPTVGHSLDGAELD